MKIRFRYEFSDFIKLILTCFFYNLNYIYKKISFNYKIKSWLLCLNGFIFDLFYFKMHKNSDINLN